MTEDPSDRYDPAAIEPKWQAYWDEHGTFRAERRPGRAEDVRARHVPVPVGLGLHVGHPEGYTATDIVARYARMRGFDVLAPDGLGRLRAARRAARHRRRARTRATRREKNIATFKRQLKMLGFSYDWSREIDTTDPGYVRWTQWIFLKLFERGLAYQARSRSTGARRSARCSPTKRSSTARASAAGTPSSGCRCGSGCSRSPRTPTGSTPTSRASTGPTRRPSSVTGSAEARGRDRLRGRRPPRARDSRLHDARRHAPGRHVRRARARAPARPRSGRPPSTRAVVAYVEAARRKSDIDRDEAKTKTGVRSGARARNPINGQEVPVWVGDYVIGTYGTGAVMAVPAHDERDHALREGVRASDRAGRRARGGCGHRRAGRPRSRTTASSATAQGRSLDIPDGTPERRRPQAHHGVARRPRGKGQRAGHLQAARLGLLAAALLGRAHPDLLPGRRATAIRASPGASSPFATTSRSPSRSPSCRCAFPISTTSAPATIPPARWPARSTGASSRRTAVVRARDEHDAAVGRLVLVLPALPRSEERPEAVEPEAYDDWMPVDLYVGGSEHAVLHLLYARFWHKVLFDLGLVKDPSRS
jgi:leucyl-tRNA synthetase